MARESILIAVMILLSLLVVAKGDKQLVHILEGKLYKRDVDIDMAGPVYRKHKNILSVLLFMVGFAAIGLSVILLTNENRFFPLAALLSFGLICLGIWGRISSFRAANRELEDAGNAPRNRAGIGGI